ncbi:YlbF family regulator [Aneurinibacillus sp. Ricciae_BoGa-3]|uniref:RicAFT regulatory complex protein RicA family protein n=1 Tax=Aneurinibacillus sp. Ricciae_BoGa-3 TaxID=3022697 RepID=UPI0023415F5A|nr:YlbF family regulator [Aneurinibacillus sp. Ricciae_BoGa-3]WCK56158.1 YlbF family regulator [Aneurinibacillus sp. Ricciae_BoGa-3]
MEEKKDSAPDYANVLNQARELADIIANSEEVARFKQAEQKVNGNAKVQGLIESIKQKQKQLVALEHRRSYDLIPQVEKELQKLQDELDAIPIVQEFQQTQEDINELLQLVTRVIANTVSDKIIVSTGGDPLYNETDSPRAKRD